MGLSNLRRNAFILLALAPVILGYQNCSPMAAAKFDASSASTVADKSGPVPVYMASGHMGRTVYSCDDGKTWVHDESSNDAARCWVSGDPNYVECDHNEFAGHGLDAGDGAFYANFGWGFNGTLRKTTDGIHWTNIRTGGWGGGVAYGTGTVFSMWDWSTSTNGGTTWTPVANNPSAILDHGFLKHVGSKIYAMGSGNGLAISADQGVTWTSNATFSSNWTHDIAEGNGRLVAIGTSPADNTNPNSMYAAWSTDGGVTWQSTTVATAMYLDWNNLIYDGHQFVAYQPGGSRWTSPDGATWTASAVKIDGAAAALPSGPMVFNPSNGTYVKIMDAWGNYYASQRAYRSTDGINWQTLDSAHFKGGHPLHSITMGTIDASGCP